VLTLRSGDETKRVLLRSTGYLGFAAYLVDARIGGIKNGFRSDSEIMACAPGWTRVRTPRAVRTKVWKISSAWVEAGLPILEAPNGITLPPWRIGVAPDSIAVSDLLALRQLLGGRQDLREEEEARSRAPSLPGCEPDKAALQAAEDMIRRGGGVGDARRFAQETLLRATGARDPWLPAEAARIEASLLLREGKLVRAKRRACDALAYFDEPGTKDSQRVADALDVLGAIAYRKGKYVEANELFAREHEILFSMDSAGADSRRTRALWCRALVALRTREFEQGMGWAHQARLAAERAGDPVGSCIAEAVELRIMAHRGGARDALDAVEELERLTRLVPATHPYAVIFCRRLLLEVLYLVEDLPAADRLAIAIVRDAEALGSARDLDAVIRLLRRHRRPALADIPPRVLSFRRDELKDWEMIDAAAVALGLPVKLDPGWRRNGDAQEAEQDPDASKTAGNASGGAPALKPL